MKSTVRVALAGLLAVGAGWVGPASAQADDPQSLASATAKQVTVTVDRIDPKVVRSDSTITVSGTLTNTTKHPMTTPIIRLQGGAPLQHRSQLSGTPAPADAFPCADWTDLPGALAPGRTVPYSTSCKAGQLGITAAGTYPVMVNLNAIQFDGNQARVGEADTTLPYFPKSPAAPTKVSWLWPIVDRPHRYTTGMQYGPSHKLPVGVFRDDVLAGSLAPTGRLGRMVSTALAAPKDVQLTLAIDPELVVEAAAMRSGYRVARGTTSVPGTGGRVAARWLSRLQQLTKRPGVTVTVLPYADPDLVALADSKLEGNIGPAYSQGRSALQKILPISNPLTLAWPADGELDDTTLYNLAGQSLSGVVLSSDALPLRSSPTPTPDAAADVPAQGSTLRAVVTDKRLDDVAGLQRFPDGIRLAEQRFISELAMITAEAPKTARNVVIAPPRRWATSPTFLKDLLADTASLPWARSGSVGAAMSATPTAQRGPLQYPASARQQLLPAAQVNGIAAMNADLNAFRKALSNSDADTLLTPYYKAMLTASSSAWRTDHALGASFLRDLGNAVNGLKDRVSIIPPSRAYTLASSSSPLVLTVANTLSVQISVRISVTARGSAGFHADPVTLVVPPNARRTVKVPAHVERSGVFPVKASIATPNGEELGPEVQLRVRSTAYGIITLGITGGAFALLLLLVGRRLFRRIRDSRRPAPPTDPVVEYPTGDFPTLTTTATKASDTAS
ncbi:MAG TPA: DUF6049 family protein [Mycobacteriales bacterium]|nr:DUF6049 family protein [Mycobacteriales bacterium]